MTKTMNVMDVERKKEHTYMPLIFCAIVFFSLLLLRDSYSVGINKYIFLVIVCLSAVCMKMTHLIYLFCFLFPLYVGLPGNYLTLILLVRLLFDIHHVKASSFIITMVIAAYILLQNFFTGHTGIVPMMFIAGVILVLLLFTYKQNLDPFPMIMMYSAGVASLGLIMLISTLQVYDFSDLMSVAFRLGMGGVNYVEKGIMNVSIDPNFYGMYSIAAISLSFPYIFRLETKLITKVCLICFAIVQMVVALVGLSRAFVLVFVVWILL